ncbi:hypothetical protein BC937DRAFT_91273 [Endogone sp. FLAS-F59071]|nr:hypothetical protein BC937DRAFT_91273 [Endogone sp. FLAS-F59071]|eukprot:RUS16387.1 hypothetical protein BC937DRAFT_91273 [Endogone sp. FLAS-F59071]
MSSKLTKQSLDALFKASGAPKPLDLDPKSKAILKKLPKTNTGLKKIKHEIRYGRQQKVKRQHEEAERRVNPMEKLKTETSASLKNLKANIVYFTQSLKPSKKEHELRRKALAYRNATGKVGKVQKVKIEESDEE